jgi:hypothetical protein
MFTGHKKAYTQQKSNAKQRGVDFELSFTDWLAIWLWSGKLEERGRGADKYCMARIGDTGSYSRCNVYITINAKNISDGNAGKIVSAETRAKNSAALAGRPKEWARGALNPMHRQEVKAKISAATRGGKHYRAKLISTPTGVFASGTEAAEAHRIATPTVYWRCKHEKLGFAYIA